MNLFKFFDRNPSSRDVAKSRLQFVLVQDRLNCNVETLEMMKNDILKVIMNYMEIDESTLDIQICNPQPGKSGEQPMLIANIPVKNLRKASK